MMRDHQNCECPTCQVDISIGMDGDYHGFHTHEIEDEEMEANEEQEHESEQEHQQDDPRNFGIDTSNLSAILGDLSLQPDADSDGESDEDFCVDWTDDESFLDDLESMEDDHVDIFDDEAIKNVKTCVMKQMTKP